MQHSRNALLTHARSANRVRGRRAANPRAEHVHPGPKHVENGAIVGKRSSRIRAIDRPDRDGRRLGGGRRVGRIRAVVARRDHDRDAGADDGGNGRIDGGGLGAAKRHAQDRLGRRAERLRVRAYPLDARYDSRIRAGPGGVEDLDGHEGGLFRDAVRRAGRRAGYVRAVAIFIGVDRVDEVSAPDGAAAELAVGGVDAGVDDVDPRAGARRGVVDVARDGAGGEFVRDASQTVRGTGLGGQRVD